MSEPRCPSCDSSTLSVERRPDGDARCALCGWSGKYAACFGETYKVVIQSPEARIKELESQLKEANEVLAEQSSVIEHIALKFDQTKLIRIIDQDVRNRFFKFVQVGPDCHEWTGSLSPQGYGQLSIGNRPYLAHRISCAIGKPHFFDFYIVDHICRNRRCVNPNHLRLIGSSLNATENSFSTASRNSLKTHCKNGHPLSGENLFLKSAKSGVKRVRACRTCMAAWRAKNVTNKRARAYLKKWEGEK